MKLKGTKLTGSSIMTVLGVICFATILVAAAVVTMDTVPIGSQKVVVDGTVDATAIEFTNSNDPDFIATANPAKATPYDFATSFSSTGPDPNGYYLVTVTGSGVSSQTSVTLKTWAGSAWSDAIAVDSFATGTVTFKITGGWAAGTVVQGFQITLNNAGSFTTTVTVATTTA